MKKFLFLAISFVFVFSWQLKKEQNGIKVYTRAVKNFKYKEFKAVMNADMDFNKTEKALLDFKNYPKWQTKIKKIEVKDGYMLKILDLPFPLSNRFAFYKIDIDRNKNELKVYLNSVPYSKLPENIQKIFTKPSCVEMSDHVLFDAVKLKNGVKVIYKAKVNPKGVPAFMFNSNIISIGYTTLSDLKKYLKH